MIDFGNTVKTTAGNIWPGMILIGHEHRGRVADIIGRATTPWGVERVEILFNDGFESLLMDETETVTVAVEPKSFRPMFRFGESETQGNATRFATYEEALGAARDKFLNWTMPTDYFVEESADPANYTWNEKDGAKSIKQDA
tara:strand:- start:253 stop:678 length:426 start_codon:yes stop_codon:yes gene_type:complete